jgi:DNA-binding response OmpR family regulator
LIKFEKGIVLLVEDNIKILDLNRRILEREGLIVLTAHTLEKARERVKVAIPDVVVLDIMLPDGSGLDYLTELRTVCDAPVLFLTAKTEQTDILNGLAAGGNDYIIKPYDIDEFRARVMRFLWLVNSARTRTKPTPSISSLLNETELSIALCAASGMSNKDIAEKVFLSESRVKTCLTSVYRKLGIVDKNDKRGMLVEILNA